MHTLYLGRWALRVIVGFGPNVTPTAPRILKAFQPAQQLRACFNRMAQRTLSFQALTVLCCRSSRCEVAGSVRHKVGRASSAQ